MRILICDDNKTICDEIRNILYELIDFEELVIDVIYTYKELREKISYSYDLIFVDIELGRDKGFEAIEFLRNKYNNYRTSVVYISAYTNYAMRLFATNPLDFLLKPIKFQDIENIINKYIKLYKSVGKIFEYNRNKSSVYVNTRDISYFESMARKVIIHFLGGGEEIIYSSMKSIVNNEALNEFVYVHQSYFVNYWMIKKFSSQEITLSDDRVIPISSQKKKDALKKYIEISEKYK
ncbi:LytR/AlgR family response regulator transcription factor [Lachnospira multipara]|uniref:Stage 0 sporulation protein A homolog n=1 Tax=Lachnospira multipara TaxID=28051 RepID=A0A1H5SW91_9FIRM|nr:LytTR family DNA-binding domain-containing protein [Lachnospira multipara]SEF54744.1 DNA-binding response regulator, LytR/AlgR family [Lachnospira multipara]